MHGLQVGACTHLSWVEHMGRSFVCLQASLHAGSSGHNAAAHLDASLKACRADLMMGEANCDENGGETAARTQKMKCRTSEGSAVFAHCSAAAVLSNFVRLPLFPLHVHSTLYTCTAT